MKAGLLQAEITPYDTIIKGKDGEEVEEPDIGALAIKES